MQQKKKLSRKVISYVLALAMVFSTFTGIVPGMSMTAYAETMYQAYLVTDSDTEDSLADKVVKFNNIDWYIIKDESSESGGSVTLIAKECLGVSVFGDNSTYKGSTVETWLKEYYNNHFDSVDSAVIEVTPSDPDGNAAKLFLLSKSEIPSSAEYLKCAEASGASMNAWWLRSPGFEDGTAACVYGDTSDVNDLGPYVNNEFGVRPALKLDLSKVTFDSDTNKFTVESVSKDPVSYMAWDETEKKLVEKTGDEACKEYEVVTADTVAFEDGKWYVVSDNVTISNRITVTGTAYLILCDGATLTASKGITVMGGNTLNIYAQSGGTGTLTATGNEYCAGIGGYYDDDDGHDGGTIVIHGGIIVANGGEYGGAGIGGSNGGTVTIHGGKVTAQGSGKGAGIGGGESCTGGTLTINGGEVEATGGSDGGAGIGSAKDVRNEGGRVTINGGTVTAIGGDYENCGAKAIGDGNGAEQTSEPSTTITIGGNVIVTAKESVDGDTFDITNDEPSTFGWVHTETHTHDDIIFTVWTDKLAYSQSNEEFTSAVGLPTQPGNYVLIKDVTLSSTWNVPTGETNLCLNGHKIDANGGAYNVLYVSAGATLNLYDEDGDSGQITGSNGTSSGYGGGVMVSGGGTFNMHGGTVTGNSAMMGGGVYIHSDNANNTFTMSGGIITGNTAQYGGGGVEVGNGKFNLSGSSTITGNTGGNVYLPNGKTVTVGALTSDASIGVTMASPGVFTSGDIAKNYIANFTSDNSAYSVVADGNELKLKAADPVASVTTSGGSVTAYTLFSDALNAWENGSTLKLLSDAEIESTIHVNNKTVTFDLNGHGIIFKGTNSYQTDREVLGVGTRPYSSGDSNLTLIDSSPDSIHFITLDDTGRGISVSDTGTESETCVKVTGGYITGGAGEGEASRRGGGVYVHYYNDSKKSNFTMNGGTIVGNTASCNSEGRGAGVFVSQKCTFTMNGGTITGNTAKGTNIGGMGGGVYVNSSGSFIMNGGTITDNKVDGTVDKSFGGGVYNTGEFVISRNAVIKENLKGSDANNVYLHDKKTIAVTGALTSDASIGVTMETLGVFTSSTDPIKASDYKDQFSSDDSTYTVMTQGNELKLGTHVHSFTYRADGATITATCEDSDGGHGETKTATLTLKAPTLTTYGGDGSAEATIEGSIEGVTIPSIVYKKGNEILENAPTNAGSYTASITLDGATASLDYIIAPKEVTISGITADDKTYDGTIDATLNYSNAVFGGKLDGDNLTISATGTFDNANVGDNKTVTITNLTLGGTSKDNYVLATTGQQTGTNAKLTAKEVGLNWADTELTYNGQEQTPTATATGLVSGDVGKVNVTVTGGQKNAQTGAYTATASGLTGDKADNYKLPDEKTTPFTISPKSISEASVTLDKTELTYNGSEQSVSVVEVSLDGKKLTADDYTVSGNTGTNKSDYTVTVTGKGNYKDAATADWKIVAKVMTVTAEPVSKPYDGNEYGIIVNVTEPSSGTTVMYGTEAGTYNLDASPKFKDAGTHTVCFKVSGNDDYSDYEGSATVTISKKAVTANISAEDKPYDGKTDATVTASVPTEALVSGDSIEITGIKGNFVDANVGAGKKVTVDSSAKSISGSGSDNYEVTIPAEATASISKSEPKVTAPAPKTLTYNGQAQALVNAGSVTGGTMYYAVTTENTAPTEKSLYTTDIPTATNVGTYYVWYKVVGDENHNDTVPASPVDVTIAKAAQAAPAESFTTSKATGSDTIDGKISGFAGTKTYQISSDNGVTWTDVEAESNSLDVKAGVYQIRYAGDKNHEAGASVSVTVGKKADQSKPEGLEAVNVSAEDAKDGEITGVSDTMEYSVDKGTTWKAVPANADKIDGLAAGEVLVRYAETDDKNAGSNTTVTVGVASKTEGVVEFKPEEGGTDVEEKAITGVDNESTKASVNDFAETQQEEGKDVKVALEITPQKEENVDKESVEETNKVVEEVFAGIDSVVTEYLAIDVAKYVDNVKETENISDTKSPLEIALKFDSKKSNPVVVRTHDGKAKAFGKLRSRPAKKDYKDAMFYIDPENATLYIYSQYFSDFAIVYATQTTYNVGFVSGTDANLSPLVVAEGGKITFSDDFLAKLKKQGYAFDGWYKDEAYTSVWDVDKDTVNSDITLYAKWNKSVSGVSVSPSEVKFTKAGETSQIKTTVTPADAANTKVTYKSSDTKVATVDANGKITAVANGTATITVTTEDGAKTATVKVTVSIPEVKQQGTEEPVQQPTKEEKAVISMNAGLKISQTGSKINIKWGKVEEADGYDVYVAYCGKKFGKAVKTINKNSTTSVTVKKINGKKINLKKNFKVYVAAYKMTDGKKEVLAKSIMGHVVGRLNTRYSNVRKITLSKSKYSVKVGKTVKVKAKTVLVDKSKKQLSNAHAAEFRYASSNRNIATVDKNGKVKGVAKGTCTIYVYARNGYAKTVKVTVK